MSRIFWVIVVALATCTALARDADPLVEAAIVRLESRGAIVKPFRVAELAIEGTLVRLGDENDGRLITAAGKIDPAVVADLKVIPKLLLEIRGPAFANEGLADLGPLANLIGLDLAGTKITADGLAMIGKLKSLKLLDLSFNRLDGKSLDNFAALEKLQFLALIDTRVDDSAVQPLVKLKSLRYLQMKGTNLSPQGREAVSVALKDCQIDWPPIQR